MRSLFHPCWCQWLAVFLIAHGAALAAGPSPAETALVQKALAAHRVPGASIAVIQGHQLLWAAGFGQRRAGSIRPVGSETVFQAASVSKPTTAMAVMLLAEQKVLKLDDDVNASLKSWKIPLSGQGSEPVTLRRLLSHSAGISVHGFAGYAVGEPVPQLVEVLKGMPPANSAPIVIQRLPGEAFQYSGGGYCIIQQLMEDLQPTPFEELMNRLVLTPCGMRHSTFEQPLKAPLKDNMAAGHDSMGNCIPGEVHVYPEKAAAGLWTTAADYAQLLLAIDRALAGSTPTPFSKPLMQAMMTVQKGKYGLGWALSKQPQTAPFPFSAYSVCSVGPLPPHPGNSIKPPAANHSQLSAPILETTVNNRQPL